ncbi:MAG: hypothetical protein ACK4XK_10000 [Casimicrobiaceae bacterium]
MSRGLRPSVRRVGPEDAETLARLASTVPPSVLAGLPLDGPAQWAARLEALAEPADIALGLFSPDGRLRAYAQLHWWRARDRLRHKATLTQLIAPPGRQGEAALAGLVEGVLGFTREALGVRRVEVMLDGRDACRGRVWPRGDLPRARCGSWRARHAMALRARGSRGDGLSRRAAPA